MRRQSLLVLAVMSLSLGSTVAHAQSEPAADDKPMFAGRITGDDVYVRSGPSANYYPVTKLNAGDLVTVYGNQDGWNAIAPPPGCFSLMSKSFIDLPGETGEGSVNADAVWVRAGSQLQPEQLYGKQLKLDRGAKVIVLGQHNEDYYRIAPPPRARLYVSAELVKRVEDDSAAPTKPNATASPTETQPKHPIVAQDKTSDSAKPEPANPEAAAESDNAPSPPDAAATDQPSPTAFRDEIAEIDRSLEQEMKQPLLHRNYEALIARYRVVAEQKDDPYAQAYAKARITQLEQASSTLAAVRELRRLKTQLGDERRAAAAQRRDAQPIEPISAGFDAVGTLRVSMLFTGTTGPKRFRLVTGDPAMPRTIGYVEVPEDMEADVAQWVGRRVGIRARSQRIETGDVDPIVIYHAGEIVPLDEAESTKSAGTGESEPTTQGG